MSSPYIGEIRMFGGSFAPNGWVLCQGQLMPIAENDALFNLIGTTYGGDGQETFGIPDLQGRVVVHQGQGSGLQNDTIGESGGVESVTIVANTTPVHNHAFIASLGAAASTDPTNQVIAQSSQIHLFTEDVASKQMNASSLAPVGGSQPHENRQQYLAINFILSLFGIFPSQT
jgi:microcystin-dependent protein